MGYTHYYRFNKKSKLTADQKEKLYQKAIKDCHKIVKFCKKNVVNLSGYSAHCKVNQYSGLNFNGVGEDGHENFVLREHLNQNEIFMSCKTARKSYDIAVTACLCLLKHRLKDLIEVESDGTPDDFNLGLDLSRLVTKLKINNPLG